MYPPPHHQTSDLRKMIAVIKQYPLAMLLTVHEQKVQTTHLPFIYNKERGTLVAHLDKNNPQLAQLCNGNTVTVVFKGPDTYISPSIYSTKQLPTWNYIMVHVSGTLQLIEDEDTTKETLIAMTHFLEAEAPRFTLSKDDPRMDRLIPYIQAFEIKITSWEGKFKLSQDKNAEDQERAKKELIKKSSEDITAFIDFIYQ